MNTQLTSFTPVLQDTGKCCITAQRRVIRRTILCILTVILCFSCVCVSYAVFRPTALTHPDFEALAVTGAPAIGKDQGFSTLKVRDGYAVDICGAPAVNGNDVFFYLSNPETNDVWLRAEVLDRNSNMIGSTGVLKQGQHLPSIRLDLPANAGETQVFIRIISYEPNTWQSCGNVSLQMTLNPNK